MRQHQGYKLSKRIREKEGKKMSVTAERGMLIAAAPTHSHLRGGILTIHKLAQ